MIVLTGPEDSTVTVREPAGWLDAVVKRRGEETETAANTWAYFDARARSYANKQRVSERDCVQDIMVISL